MQYTWLFKIIFGIQLSNGNYATNSGDNLYLTIPFEGGMHSIKRRVRVYPGTEGTNQNRHPPLIHLRLCMNLEIKGFVKLNTKGTVNG